ncbi:hypothetical protein [Halobacteriovorax sp. HLS]|uniref:hypothetical protein n=1 Tax=Halobacteriovorax sp. HLS TaxID=2234000 RepID=UPI000FDA563E|nr:hypothetical protein [Halobacteriovorax sp. HLS]
MKLFKLCLFLWFSSPAASYAGSSKQLFLRAIVRPNINVYFDENQGIRVHTNSYIKKSIKNYKYSGKLKKVSSNKKLKLLEISMN